MAAFSPCAVTAPASSASLALDLVMASAISTRSTGTKLSPALVATLLGLVEHAGEGGVDVGLARVARDLGHARHGEVGGLAHALRRSRRSASIRLAASPWSSSMQRLQQVLGQDALVALARGDGLRGLEESARAFGELLEVHVSVLSSARPGSARSAARTPRASSPDVGRAALPRKGPGPAAGVSASSAARRRAHLGLGGLAPVGLREAQRARPAASCGHGRRAGGVDLGEGRGGEQRADRVGGDPGARHDDDAPRRPRVQRGERARPPRAPRAAPPEVRMRADRRATTASSSASPGRGRGRRRGAASPPAPRPPRTSRAQDAEVEPPVGVARADHHAGEARPAASAAISRSIAATSAAVQTKSPAPRPDHRHHRHAAARRRARSAPARGEAAERQRRAELDPVRAPRDGRREALGAVDADFEQDAAEPSWRPA